MARQTFYLAKDVKHPLYKTRMLQAGPLELDASAARLFRRLGVDLSEEAPKRAAKNEERASDEAVAWASGVASEIESARTSEAPKPAAKAPAKKAVRRKKS